MHQIQSGCWWETHSKLKLTHLLYTLWRDNEQGVCICIDPITLKCGQPNPDLPNRQVFGGGCNLWVCLSVTQNLVLQTQQQTPDCTSRNRKENKFCFMFKQCPIWQCTHLLSKRPTVRTVQGSKTSHVYCSFQRGLKLSKMVLVRTHFGPYLAIQYASVLPRLSFVDFIGSKLFALWIPSSKTPREGLQSCLAVGRLQLV